MRKLTSRKLWVAVAGFVSGLIIAFGGQESTAVAATVMQRASVIGYLLADGLTDTAMRGGRRTKTVKKLFTDGRLMALYAPQ